MRIVWIIELERIKDGGYLIVAVRAPAVHGVSSYYLLISPTTLSSHFLYVSSIVYDLMKGKVIQSH